MKEREVDVEREEERKRERWTFSHGIYAIIKFSFDLHDDMVKLQQFDLYSHLNKIKKTVDRENKIFFNISSFSTILLFSESICMCDLPPRVDAIMNLRIF